MLSKRPLRIAPPSRHGVVLVVVLVVLALLSLAAYTFTDLMYAEHRAALAHGAALQARALADSGLEVAEAFLQQDPQLQTDSGGTYDNPAWFSGRLVVDSDSADERGRFALVAPRLGDDGYYRGLRFGLEDESTKLNLNTLLAAEQQQEGGGRSLLLALPNMTEDIADAILDWLDSDDEPREFGAELNDYAGLDPPYAPRNGPLESIEELLLVRGVTPWLLFGADTNRNGVVDASELGSELIGGVVNDDGSMDRGWSAYLTLWSMERNVTPEGNPRIHLNADDLEQLHTDLTAAVGGEWATFVVAYRQFGPYTGNNNPQPAGGRSPDFSRQARFPLTTALDLIGVRVEMRFAGESDPIVVASPWMEPPLDLSPLLDFVSVNSATIIPGRININQASRVVLAGIPGIDDQLVDQIISQRDPDPTTRTPGRHNETWLLAEGLVDLETMKTLMPFVTGGGSVFRVQSVGYFEQGGQAARVEAILDATGVAPRRLFWRDISHLGRGYPVETLGLGL